jgi:hypothetical protein
MSIIPWNCAHGDAPVVVVELGSDTIELAPEDDGVDSNIVRISARSGSTIRWFGDGPPAWVTKRVIFPPGVLLIHNPPMMTLLGEQDRQIDVISIGTYTCDGQGNWAEISFTSTGAREIGRRLDDFEQRLARMENRMRGAGHE